MSIIQYNSQNFNTIMNNFLTIFVKGVALGYDFLGHSTKICRIGLGNLRGVP